MCARACVRVRATVDAPRTDTKTSALPTRTQSLVRLDARDRRRPCGGRVVCRRRLAVERRGRRGGSGAGAHGGWRARRSKKQGAGAPQARGARGETRGWGREGAGSCGGEGRARERPSAAAACCWCRRGWCKGFGGVAGVYTSVGTRRRAAQHADHASWRVLLALQAPRAAAAAAAQPGVCLGGGEAHRGGRAMRVQRRMAPGRRRPQRAPSTPRSPAGCAQARARGPSKRLAWPSCCPAHSPSTNQQQRLPAHFAPPPHALHERARAACVRAAPPPPPLGEWQLVPAQRCGRCTCCCCWRRLAWRPVRPAGWQTGGRGGAGGGRSARMRTHHAKTRAAVRRATVTCRRTPPPPCCACRRPGDH